MIFDRTGGAHISAAGPTVDHCARQCLAPARGRAAAISLVLFITRPRGRCKAARSQACFTFSAVTEARCVCVWGAGHSAPTPSRLNAGRTQYSTFRGVYPTVAPYEASKQEHQSGDWRPDPTNYNDALKPAEM
ncbi:hypothetical protein NDU88_002874 [Pleurodeles waltl]|uniref:Uncharacterized protein n=1 Tax=Pleurodeles waltl TaxID=8319 RepID=A0AAV7UCC6_PLEWA|nr:hypothetical protein NDU88_002874 [Pleurodeles waltl]